MLAGDEVLATAITAATCSTSAGGAISCGNSIARPQPTEARGEDSPASGGTRTRKNQKGGAQSRCLPCTQALVSLETVGEGALAVHAVLSNQRNAPSEESFAETTFPAGSTSLDLDIRPLSCRPPANAVCVDVALGGSCVSTEAPVLAKAIGEPAALEGIGS